MAEGEWKAGGLTMHNLWFQLQGSIHTMELIAGLVADISARQVPHTKYYRYYVPVLLSYG